MKTILREDDAAVSEVVGTILILAMTVVLFSSIILWVGSIPAPTTQTHVDLRPTMAPMYDGSGNEIGVNITLLHRGAESLNPTVTVIYVISQRGAAPPVTAKLFLQKFNPSLPGNKSGIVDGRDAIWDIGERWVDVNFYLRSTDTISVTVVDLGKNTVVWTGRLTADPGTRPPIFVDKWTDDTMGTPAIDPVQATKGFFLYARVFDQDGDLNKNSVWATLTIFFGTGDSCANPQKMHDDGVYPDAAAGDGIFTLGAITCVSPPYPALNWDGSIILLNATDMKSHQTKTRLVLHVVEPFTQGEIQTIPTALWQYIGFAQVRTGDVWLTNLSKPYGTTDRYQPFRVLKAWLGSGAMFHFQLANHGNTTIFLDGWTEVYFTNTQSASGFALYIVAPCSPTLNAGSGGVVAYPGSSTVITDFKYAHSGTPAGCVAGIPNAVLDINPLNQEKGGNPYELMIYNKVPFGAGSSYTWPQSASYFLNILVSGMAGPVNMTYQQILDRWGPTYNPYDHLRDVDPTTRTQWYAQVIPFIGMVTY
jgi:hypothetical protein